ncbi:MAG: adenylosuccinate synthase, partial [Cyanobacteria bacterium M_surface_7_m2_040]|nr:adenylosuccinate synthase [Cyanobacteria bacterium M_surface_7_m2_040]
MANVVVIGAQWGDEGKGKITDLLSRSADVVVRYQGGVNAGHTIVVDGQVLKLHLIPSGILYPDTVCLIGSGTVVDPKVMLGELDMLLGLGIDVSGLKLASTAHVTMPYHRLLDQATEQRRGERRIGTTGRGIGPTYADKSERNGIRVIDLLDQDRLRERLEGPMTQKNELLQTIYGVEPLDAEAVIAEYAAYGKRLAPHVVDCTRTIHQAARARKNILFEGAQGTLLDLDHGTYPYV